MPNTFSDRSQKDYATMNVYYIDSDKSLSQYEVGVELPISEVNVEAARQLVENDICLTGFSPGAVLMCVPGGKLV